MKPCLLVLLLLSQAALAGITVVTDLDDTIKITDSGSVRGAPLNSLFKLDVYTGIPEAYRGLTTYAGKVHVVTASPGFLRPKIKKLFVNHGIQVDSLTLKNPLSRQGKREWKIKVISALLKATRDDVILIGDDVGEDPEVYAAVAKLYPERILASYIHVVKGRRFGGPSMPYWTSFDLALREHLAGRMEASAVQAAAGALLNGKALDKAFPKFAQCPSSAGRWDWQSSTAFAWESEQLKKRILGFCRGGSSSGRGAGSKW